MAAMTILFTLFVIVCISFAIYLLKSDKVAKWHLIGVFIILIILFYGAFLFRLSLGTVVDADQYIRQIDTSFSAYAEEMGIGMTSEYCKGCANNEIKVWQIPSDEYEQTMNKYEAWKKSKTGRFR